MQGRNIYKVDIIKNNMIIPGDPKGSPDDFVSVTVFIDNAYLLRLKNYLFKSGLKYSVRKFINNKQIQDRKLQAQLAQIQASDRFWNETFPVLFLIGTGALVIIFIIVYFSTRDNGGYL